MKKKIKEREREETTQRITFFLKPSLESWVKAHSSIRRIVHDSFQFHRHFFFMFYNAMYGNQRRKEKE